MAAPKRLNLLKAAIGIEPMNKGFAELKGQVVRALLSVVKLSPAEVFVDRDFLHMVYYQGFFAGGFSPETSPR